MFKHLTDKINYSQLELEVLKFWKENRIFEKSITTREGKPGFTFYEGPPTANGMPGIHHVMSRALKDLVCRYKTMRGFQVHRKAGWDTHGLPVEIEVEKSLGIKHKDEIVKYGVAKFNEECKKSVWKYKTDWENMTERMGYWVDLSNPYITFTNEYIESIWWALKQYFDKGFIYKGYKIQPYCPRCETPLSTHEVSLGYQDVKDPSVYVRFKVKTNQIKNTLYDPDGMGKYSLSNGDHYLLVWTTTPWTLVSNVALAVNEKVEYAVVEYNRDRYILAKKALEDPVLKDLALSGHVFHWMGSGNELVGLEYEPIFESDANRHLTVNEFLSYRVYKIHPHSDFDNAERAYVRIDDSTKQVSYDDYFVLTQHDGRPTLIAASLWIRMRPLPKFKKFVLGQIVKTISIEFTEPDWSFKAPQAFFLVAADFVTTEEGSGIVHIAPAYGEDDYQISKKYGLPAIHPVNKSGEFGLEVKEFAGKFVKDADAEIIQNLKSRGLLFKKETITHSYPHCWRCDTPLLYYARESWYIATTKYAGRMVELNKTINWVPEVVGEGRFGNWLEENKDWSLSRDRFWGTPLPIWVCDTCGNQECIGSIADLEKISSKKVTDLHKPFVDEFTWKCECGGTKRRTPELIDVWFDSGAMPFAQWHYPFENQETFQSQHPADFICEGIDQTRGWFYSLHAISTFLFDKPAYKNILVNELVLDKEGQKMSKSKGNTVDPFAILEKYGADTTRWYLVTNSPPWRPTLFDEKGLVEVQRKFFSTLLNTYSFFALYANIDGFKYEESKIPLHERQEIDRWIISSLNSLIKRYEEAMEQYDVTKAARAVSDFIIDQLSNWYVRRNRRRFWKSENGKDKITAYQTLYECLITIAKLMAPIAPYIADEIYRNLNLVTKKEPFESVHLAMIPTCDESAIDNELEAKMDKAQRIVSLVRAIRNKTNLRVRQPLKRVIVPVSNARDRDAIRQMESVILDEINVKAIEYVSDDSEIVHKRAKPNFKAIGPKYGKSVQAVASAIKGLSVKEIKELETKGELNIPVNGSPVHLTREDVEIFHEDIKGWQVETDHELTVALDTTLTEDLINEGQAREFINRVQNMRKDAGFEVTDRIRIYFTSSERFQKAISTMKEYIQSETLAVELSHVFQKREYTAEWEIDDLRCTISIERVR